MSSLSSSNSFLPGSYTEQLSEGKKINGGTFVLQQRQNNQKRKVKWPQPSKRNGLNWEGSFRKGWSDSRAQSFPHFHQVSPTQQALEGQVAANTSKGSLSLHRAAVEGNIQVSKGHHELQRAADIVPVLPSQNQSAICSVQRIPLTHSHVLERAFQQQLGTHILGEILAHEIYLCHKQLPSLPLGLDQKRGQAGNELKTQISAWKSFAENKPGRTGQIPAPTQVSNAKQEDPPFINHHFCFPTFYFTYLIENTLIENAQLNLTKNASG